MGLLRVKSILILEWVLQQKQTVCASIQWNVQNSLLEYLVRILKNWIENSKTIMNTFDLHLIYFDCAFILSKEHEFNLLQFSFHPIKFHSHSVELNSHLYSSTLSILPFLSLSGKIN